MAQADKTRSPEADAYRRPLSLKIAALVLASVPCKAALTYVAMAELLSRDRGEGTFLRPANRQVISTRTQLMGHNSCPSPPQKFSKSKPTEYFELPRCRSSREVVLLRNRSDYRATGGMRLATSSRFERSIDQSRRGSRASQLIACPSVGSATVATCSSTPSPC